MADEKIETAFEAAMASGKVNGAIVCATDVDGNFTYNYLAGERTLLSGDKVPQALDDMLCLASATKLIAAVAVLQGVEDGLFTLDEDITKFAPAGPVLARQSVLTDKEDESGEQVLKPRDDSRPITLEMLLSHTAGTAYHFLEPKVGKWHEKNMGPPLKEGETRPVEEAFAYPLAFQPGTGWMYGTGIDWAGRILEIAEGKTLGDHIRERIAKPLGIDPDDAQFYPVKGEHVRKRLVDLNPQDPLGAGKAVMGALVGDSINTRSKGCFGGHGLFMTAQGYMKVLHSLLANDGKLLRKETVENMFQNHVGPDAEKHFDDMFNGPAGHFFRVGTDGTKVGFGLSALLTLEDAEGWYGKGTLTWGGGLSFAWFIDPKNGLCGLCAIQASISDYDVNLLTSLKNTFRHDVYRKRAAWKEGAKQ